MMKSSYKLFNVLKIMGLSIFFVSLGLLPNICFGWGSSNFIDLDGVDSAHYFIIDKAIQHIKDKGLLIQWPLDDYRIFIRYGAYWADFPYYPIKLECDWAGLYSGTCDALHHYFTGDCIELTDAGGPCIGDGNGLGAPKYAQSLYDLAVKFYPGGDPIPNIHNLPFLRSAGYMTTYLDGRQFGPFAIGGHPFAYEIECAAYCGEEAECYCNIEYAYYWPGFTADGNRLHFCKTNPCIAYSIDRFSYDAGYSALLSAIESVRSSLIFLGWAIHLVEDMSMPDHALNKTGTHHKNFEDRADELIQSGAMNHLPLSIDKTYSSPYITVRPDYFNKEWTILEFAQRSAQLSVEAKYVPGSDVLGIPEDHQIEIDLDTCIKIAAGVIYKFFSEIELPSDNFEPNNTTLTAETLSSGVYENLTIHAPFDDDFYQVICPANYGRIRILVNYDVLKFNDDLNINIEYTDCDTEPCIWVKSGFRIMNTGGIYEEEFVPFGRHYLIEVSGSGRNVPVPYSILVFSGVGDLPPDVYEENNTYSTASVLRYGLCDFSGKVNIHNASDKDFYKIDWAQGYSIQAEIFYNPNFGDLKLYLNDKQATESIISENGTKKTLRINDCGESSNYVIVRGAANFYDFCINRIQLQKKCPGFTTTGLFRGKGIFTYTDFDCYPGIPPTENTAKVKKTMRSTITNESSSEVFWTIGSEFEDLGYKIAVELHCERQPEPNLAQATIKLLHPRSGDIWWQGKGTGTCYGLQSPKVITGFSASAELVSIIPFSCIASGHGILTIEGYIDTDNDGIPDQTEIATGTNPNSYDTDSDGIPDGIEDANQNGSVDYSETDPRLFDSDDDGISDGVERGLTSPGSNDTDINVFRADEDPSTTTDPNRVDTDEDGLSDGVEDANLNGRLDPGETSPLVKDIFDTNPNGGNNGTCFLSSCCDDFSKY
jgi:hypothetical protein